MRPATLMRYTSPLHQPSGRGFQVAFELPDARVEEAAVRADVEVELLPLAGDEEHGHALSPGIADFEIDVRPRVAQVGQHEAGRANAVLHALQDVTGESRTVEPLADVTALAQGGVDAQLVH